MFLKTSKDNSAFMIIYSVEVLFTLRNEQLCSCVQQMFTEPATLNLGVWWGGMVEDKDAQEIAALKESGVLKQAVSM